MDVSGNYGLLTEQLQNALNQAGSSYWELVSVTSVGQDWVLLVFTRPVQGTGHAW